MLDVITTLLKVGSVFAILAAFAWWARRHGARNGRNGLVQVISRAPVSQRSAVAVVKVGDKAYLLGVTDGQVNLLDHLDADQLPADPPGVGGSFAAQLDAATTRVEQPATVGEAIVVTVRRLRARRAARATAPRVPGSDHRAVPVRVAAATTTAKPKKKSGTKRGPGKAYTASGARR